MAATVKSTKPTLAGLARQVRVLEKQVQRLMAELRKTDRRAWRALDRTYH